MAPDVSHLESVLATNLPKSPAEYPNLELISADLTNPDAYAPLFADGVSAVIWTATSLGAEPSRWARADAPAEEGGVAYMKKAFGLSNQAAQASLTHWGKNGHYQVPT